jgi:hypothetical protein
VGYFGGTFQSAKTYTLPTTQSSGLETCTVTRFAVWSIESIHNNTTVGGTSTVSQVVTTFETSGYPSSTTSPYTGTLTGAISSWNGTNCNVGLQSSTIESTSSSAISTSCTILAEGQVIMQVVNSTTGNPIPSATVQAEFLPPECPPNPNTTSTSSPMVTNGTGFVTFGGEVGNWYLTVNGYGYPVEVSTLPERSTCVTFGLPSGDTSITYSGFLESGCQFGLPPHH